MRLISEGLSENEAVGTVISEFGNLDELSETLGLNRQQYNTPSDNRRPSDISSLYLSSIIPHSSCLARRTSGVFGILANIVSR